MNPIFLRIGNITIYWYSIFILLAIITACSIILFQAKKENISKKFIEDLFFYTIIFGLIGARIYYVIFEYQQYINNPIDIFKVWEGGLAIHGGIIAGLITIIVLTKKHKISTLKITDMVVIGLIIGQAIGRWGNFMNGEAYGPDISLYNLQQLHIPQHLVTGPLIFIENILNINIFQTLINGPIFIIQNISNLHIPQFIIDGMNINGVYHHPTFLYESLWNVLGFIILITFKSTKSLKNGQLTGIYFIWYSVGRFIIESLRQDSLMLFGILKQAQIISILLIIIGIVIIIYAGKKNNNQPKKQE